VGIIHHRHGKRAHHSGVGRVSSQVDCPWGEPTGLLASGYFRAKTDAKKQLISEAAIPCDRARGPVLRVSSGESRVGDRRRH